MSDWKINYQWYKMISYNHHQEKGLRRTLNLALHANIQIEPIGRRYPTRKTTPSFLFLEIMEEPLNFFEEK